LDSIGKQYARMSDEAVQKVSKYHKQSGLRFIYITDLHHELDGNQLRAADAVRDLAVRLQADFVLCGGDLSINGPKADALAAQQEITSALVVPGIPLLIAKGNHDDNSIYDAEHCPGSSRNVIFPRETRDILLAGLKERARFDDHRPEGLYYFVDFPTKQTRVIVLDCNDLPYSLNEKGELKYPGQWQYAFSSSQMNWLAKEALDLRDHRDWKVLIASHVPLLQDGVIGADYAITGERILWGIVQAFRHGGTFELEEGEGDLVCQSAADFRAQGPGIVVGCLFGHVHTDQVIDRDGVPHISTINACTHQEFPECPERLVNTVSETALDIMTLDYNRSMIYIHRFGAGNHREIPFR
jgi:hypothetical protein